MNRALKSRRKINPDGERLKIQKRANAALGIIRSIDETGKASTDNRKQLQKHLLSGVEDRYALRAWLKNIDLLITERAMLDASSLLLKKLKGSRGAFVYKGDDAVQVFKEEGHGTSSCNCPDGHSLPTSQAYAKQSYADRVIETVIDYKGNSHSKFIPVRPLPEPDVWFEAVWARFMKGEVFES